MESIIRQLYNGQVYPAEDINPNDPKHREASEKYNEELEKLKEKLSPECIELLEKVQGHESEITEMDMFYGFKEGLRIGILMMYELLGNN